MPINTDVEIREKCFGEIDKYNEDDCEEKCCFIEMDLCIKETEKRRKNKEIICRENMLKKGICMFTNKPCLDYPVCGWKKREEIKK